MSGRRIRRLYLFLGSVTFSCQLFGQSPPPPKEPKPGPAFEVASIKESRPPSSVESIQAGQFHVGISIHGSRADYGFMSLADLIPYAYRVKRLQISVPSWMNETRWDISATIPKDETADRAPEMMQTLLAERFKLSVHEEKSEQPIYMLVVGKGGLKIQKTAAAEEEASAAQPAGSGSPAPGLNVRINNDGVAISGGAAGSVRMTASRNGGIQMQMPHITMEALSDRLTQFMDRPVVDATQLNGSYQVALDLPVEAMNGTAFMQKLAALAGLGSFGIPGTSDFDSSIAAIIETVKALGLELQPRKAPLDTIIVDHGEKFPSAN